MIKMLPTRLQFSQLRFLLFFPACFLFFFSSLYAQSVGCSCTNCPLELKDLFSGTFPITVQNATNPTLGQNGQGLCGVKIHFDHTAICDLQISLTSPSGTTVNLVGPIGATCTNMGNVGTDWDITFLPCGDPAVAPDPGFAAVWNTADPWAANTNYTGSYYPHQGCLQQFMGPVNGTWTLSVLDGQAQDMGNLFNYTLIFCDPSGIDCFNCLAEAGNLTQPDVVRCEGNVALTLPPTYTNTAEPTNTLYAYAYVISQPNGVILDILPTPNLSAYPAGIYNICGLSYYTTAAGQIPVPNGVLTVTQLRNQLNTNVAPFCGDISVNCVGVTIVAPPPDIEETVEICAPNCYDFYSTFYCQNGTYIKTLTDGICSYKGTLHLTVHPQNNTFLFETVCAGNCSTHPLFPTACTQGPHQATVENMFGCDSTVHLNLTVITVVANIQLPVPVLTCAQPTAVLMGTGSTTGTGTIYQWSASNGGNIVGSNSGINATVDKAGKYQLIVCRSQGGKTCCDTAIVTVTSTQSVPTMPVITGSSSVCFGQNSTYSVAPIANATNYTWTVPAGATITSGQGTASIIVNWTTAGGNICVTANNLCGPSLPACLNVSTTPVPSATQPLGSTVICADSTVSYSIPLIPAATAYIWMVHAPSTIASGQGTNAITVYWATTIADSVCVRVVSACDTSAPVCLPVNVLAPPIANAGMDGAACGLVYNLSAIPSINNGTGIWKNVAGPGNVVFGSTTLAGTTATVSQTGLYAFEWRESNGFCTDADTTMVNYQELPVSGLAQVACDAANQNYTVVFAVSGGTAPYTIPGGTFANGLFTSNPVASGQIYNFTVTDANGCTAQAVTGAFTCNCSSNAGQMSQQPLSACPGNSVQAQYQGGGAMDATDVSAYILHTNSGPALGTVLAENTTGMFSFGNGMTYGTTYYISYVVGDNLNGLPDPADPCFSVASGQPVTFYNNPVAFAGMDDSTCGLTLPVSGNAGNGLWSLSSSPNGATATILNAASASTTVTASNFGTYTLTYTLTANGCTGSDDVALTFNESAAAGSIVRTCDATNENYTVSFTISGGLAPYTVNSSPVAGNNFSSAPLAGGQSYSFMITDVNNCSSPAITGTFNCSCATNAGQMDQSLLTACGGMTLTGVFQGGENLDGNDMLAWVLHTDSGTALGMVLAQNQTGIFSFLNGMTYGTTYYVSRVAGNNLSGFPDPADPCFSVAQGQPVIFLEQPTPNAGPNAAICGQTITLAAVNSGFAGSWSQVSGAGLATFTAVTNPVSTVQVSATGTYVFRWTETNGICSALADVTIKFNDNPTVSLLTTTCDPTNTAFTLSFSGLGGQSPYTVAGISGSFSGATFTSAALPNNTIYSFTLTDANGCSSPAVGGSHNCNCATNAGQMVLTPLTACGGMTLTGVFQGGEILDANDVLAWVLHTGAGTALGTVLAQNQTGIFSFVNGMTYGTTYYVSRVAGNNLSGFPDPTDPCFSVAQGQPVIFLEQPTPNAGPNAAVCGQTFTLAAVNDGFSGSWSQVSGAGLATFTAVTNPASAVQVSATGTYVFRWTETNGICSATADVTIKFNASPVVNGLMPACNPTNTAYTLTYTVSGGLAPYMTTGLAGSFTGSSFTSTLLPENSAYSFTVTDANGCVSPNINGSHSCNCATSAGTMVTTPATFCADQPATATWNNNATLDGDDAVQYILHNQAGANLGVVYATNAQPTFNFGAGLQTGVVYYISAIAGNGTGGSVSLNDPCLSIASGTPVQWKPLPTATLTGDATICNGSSTTLNFTGTGVYPLTLTYSNGTGTPVSLTLSSASGANMNVSPVVNTTYTLTSVSDGTNPTCSANMNIPVTVTVNQPVSAGTALAPTELCAGLASSIPLSSKLLNATPGGQWTETSTPPSLPGAFNAATGTFQTGGQAAGTYTFRYSITAIAPCPNDNETVTVILYALPIADAGPMQTIDCNQSSVELGGSGTSSGAVYDWTLNGSSVGQSALLSTTSAGLYTLSVKTAFGCSASDTVSVLLGLGVPQAKAIVRTIKCFGDNNGRITLDSIISAFPPVLFSINGGPFGVQSDFSSLTPGTYTVTLQAANGCEWVMPDVVLAEPQQLTVNLGPNVQAALGDSVLVSADLSVPLSTLQSLLWQPTLDTANATALIQHFLPLENQLITIQVADSNGCKANSSLQIALDRKRHVYIGNILKPGSSLFNDHAVVYGGHDVAEVESFQIFDRWGAMLFQATHFQPDDVSNSWDGKFKSKPVTPGVYVYYAVVKFIDGKSEVFQGDMTVIR